MSKTIEKVTGYVRKRWERRYGARDLFECENFKELIRILRTQDFEGYADVKVSNACLSNFAPLYLCHTEEQAELQTSLAREVTKSAQIYSELIEKYKIPEGSSLFLRAVKEEDIRLDALFGEFIDGKKLRFLGASLARFAPLTRDIRYSALFESGRQLRYQVSPSGARLEPFIPVFYSVRTPSRVEALPYADVELHGKILPLPADWRDLLQRQGTLIHGSPYCIYVPSESPYSIDPVGAETSMIIDAWISFYLPKLQLELPWYAKYEPDSDESRNQVKDFFADIYRSLVSQQETQVEFVNDVVRPYLHGRPLTFNMAKIRRLIKQRAH